MPIAICSSVNGPPGSTTVQGPRPTTLRLGPDPDHIATSPTMIAIATMRFSQAGSRSIEAAASGW